MYPLDTRIYIKLELSEASRKVLQDFIKKLSDHVAGRPVDPVKWCVTILHFGVPEHVFYDVQRDLPNITKATFQEAFKRYIDRAKQNLPQPTSLVPSGLELFGISQNVAVLSLEPNELIREAHAVALGDVVEFLKECGLSDPEVFMKGSINFKWAHELKPHITLFRSVKKFDAGSMVPEQKIDFIAARLRGVPN